MTTVRYPGLEILNDAQRGYKQPGKHLLPRDAYDAYEISYYKLHGRKGLEAARHAEAAAYSPGPQEDCRMTDYDPYGTSLRKLRGLSTRNRKLAEYVFYCDGRVISLPRSVQRVVRAMGRAYDAERCMEADRKLLVNAY